VGLELEESFVRLEKDLLREMMEAIPILQFWGENDF
jgi:hypothetical protein